MCQKFAQSEFRCIIIGSGFFGHGFGHKSMCPLAVRSGPTVLTSIFLDIPSFASWCGKPQPNHGSPRFGQLQAIGIINSRLLAGATLRSRAVPRKQSTTELDLFPRSVVGLKTIKKRLKYFACAQCDHPISTSTGRPAALTRLS